MGEIRTIKIEQNIFAKNDVIAEKTRERLKAAKVLFLNFMSAPGSGKTSVLIALINALKAEYKIGVMDVDIETTLDASRVADATGVASVQIHNGGLCHIDAEMTSKALKEMNVEDLDILIMENIGNLVCPAEFDIGAHINIMLTSVPEGDDKPLKYPLMFRVSDAVIINKIDTVGYFDFDFGKAEDRIHSLNSKALIFKTSAKTGEGIGEVADWIRSAAF